MSHEEWSSGKGNFKKRSHGWYTGGSKTSKWVGIHCPAKLNIVEEEAVHKIAPAKWV